jgi:hypothetical protein
MMLDNILKEQSNRQAKRLHGCGLRPLVLFFCILIILCASFVIAVGTIFSFSDPTMYTESLERFLIENKVDTDILAIAKNNLLEHWDKTRNTDASKFYLVFEYLTIICCVDIIIFILINIIFLFNISHNIRMLGLLLVLLSFFIIIISSFFVTYNLLLCDYDPFLYLFEFADDNINGTEIHKHLNILLKKYIMQQLPIERFVFLLTCSTTNSISFFAALGLIITFMEIVSLTRSFGERPKPEPDVEN